MKCRGEWRVNGVVGGCEVRRLVEVLGVAWNATAIMISRMLWQPRGRFVDPIECISLSEHHSTLNGDIKSIGNDELDITGFLHDYSQW